MTDRVHVLMERAEKERFRRLAEREGKTLSEWLREAAAEKAAASAPRDRLNTTLELERFFEACDAREVGREPDWEEHRGVIDRSRSSGQGAA